MAQLEKTVRIALNQQQIELLDRTLAGAGAGAGDREDLVRMALREFFARHGAGPAKNKD
jgi:hypothetical protein